MNLGQSIVLVVCAALMVGVMFGPPLLVQIIAGFGVGWAGRELWRDLEW